MSKNLEIKKQIVEDVVGEMGESTVIFNYSSISASEMDELRAKLSETETKLKVVKNTLIKRVLEKAGIKLDQDLEGQNAILISKSPDFITTIKSLFGFMKKNDKGQVTIGVLDGVLISKDQVESLSKLPSRQELIAQVVSGFISPIRSFIYTLNGVSGNFVRVLSAIKDKKSEGGDA